MNRISKIYADHKYTHHTPYNAKEVSSFISEYQILTQNAPANQQQEVK